jgi:hypothetical protein
MVKVFIIIYIQFAIPPVWQFAINLPNQFAKRGVTGFWQSERCLSGDLRM